jgi:hypothetical protein
MNNHYLHATILQDSVKATRYDTFPCSIEYSDLKGKYQNIEIEARGSDGSYVRSFITVTRSER